MKSTLKTLSACIIGIMVVILLSGCSAKSSSGEEVSSTDTSAFAAAQQDVSADVDASSDTVDSMIELSVIGTETTIYPEDYGTAEKGMEYLFISIEAANNGTVDEEIIESDIAFYADGNTYEPVTSSRTTYDGLLGIVMHPSKVPAGRKTAFYTVLLIPEACGDIEMVYGGTSYTVPHVGHADTFAEDTATDAVLEYAVGDTISNSVFEITLTSAMQTDYIADYGSYYYSPDEGKHFIILFFNVKNVSGQDVRFNYLSHFDAYVDDYTCRFTGFSYTDIEGVEALRNQDYTDIPPQKSLVGYCALEVPDGWKTIELTMRDGTFFINPENVSIS